MVESLLLLVLNLWPHTETVYLISLLTEHTGYEVITCTGDVISVNTVMNTQ